MENNIASTQQMQHGHQEFHVHHSQRAGHNRITSSRKRRNMISNILFLAMTIIAIVSLGVVLYDSWFGLF